MKKLLSLTLVAVMLLSTLMLTSCDPVESVKGFINQIVGGKDGEARTTITEEEWKKAWDINNFTFELKADGGGISILTTGEIVRIEYAENEFTYGITYDAKAGVQLYETSIGYLGIKDDNLGINVENISLRELGFFDELEFSEVTYDESKKAYIKEDEMAYYEFHFEDRELVYAKMEPTDPEEEGLAEVTKIGTTVIEIGEYTIINDGKVDPSRADTNVTTTVTSEELAAHLDLRNFTIHTALVEDGMSGEISLKAAQNGIELSVSVFYEDMKQYVAIVDGELYSVEEYGDGHLATSLGMTMDQLEETISEIKPEVTLDYLTYDEAGRYYKFEQGGEVFYLYFENGQLVKAVYVRAEIYDIPSPDPSVSAPEPIIEYYEVIFVVTDLGTTVVDIPEYTLNTYR